MMTKKNLPRSALRDKRREPERSRMAAQEHKRCEGVRSGGVTDLMTPPRRRGSKTLNAGARNRYHLSMVGPIARVRSAHDVGDAWTAADAAELYEIARWGKGYFSIGENGQVKVHPTKNPSRSIDLKQLVDDLQRRGIGLPTLIRFRDILADRLQDIYEAFQGAIAQHEYSGRYICVYPIKVNQQRQVVEEVLDFGRQYQFGLEAGSKPELLAVVALASNETPIICNGFKDAEFIEMAMLAQKIGRRIIPVV